MKKIIAILLSVLMLCTAIPFAAVSATEEPVVQLVIVDELDEVNAGEEFQVEVNILGLEDTTGLIAATVEIVFDTAVFEVVTNYDEDEEMWIPAIEVGSKYNASGNKYIMFGQINDVTGAMKDCLMKYQRATASATQVRREAHFYTVTLKVKDDAVSGTYELNAAGRTQLVCHGNINTSFTTENTSIKVNGSAPACEHEYENECDKNCALCGEETRPEAEHEFFNDCETVCIHCFEEVRTASHHGVHAAAKAPTCGELGNIEHWYCDVCGAAWLDADCSKNTNLRAVILPNTGEHTYDDEYDADCNVCGGIREVPEKPVEIAYGDLNGDGAINNRDMALMQQYINKWDVTIDLAAADVNNDGAVNNRDLALLQQYINKWDVVLGPQ